MTNEPGATVTAPDTAPRSEGAKRAALIAALDVLGTGPEERFERITRIARQAFGVTGSFLNLADDTRMTVKSQQMEPRIATHYDLDDTFCGRTLHLDGPVVVPDARADARYADLGFVTGEHQVRFYAGAPLTIGDGRTKIGTLCLIDSEPRTLEPDDLALLADLARWAERELAVGLDEDRLRSVLRGMEPAPTDVPGYLVDGVSVPYGVVSGDYHDWQVVDGGVHVTVADVMGKGMAAGLLASGIRGALIARSDRGPDVAVAELESQVAPELSRAEAFATLFHGRLTPRTGRFDFVDAGHGLVLHLRADGTENVLRSLDLPIGLHPAGIGRASGSVALQRGDALLVVTDGVLELWDGTLASLSELGALYRAAAGVDEFLDQVRTLAVERRPEDDVTVVVVARDA
jgi:hypothetical protein